MLSLFFILYENILIPVLIVAAVAIAAAVVFFVLRHIRKKSGAAPEKSKKLSKKQIFIQGLQANIDSYSEMFEPVYSVSVGKNKKQEETFAAWNEAVAAGPEEDGGYKALFNKLFGDYAEWGKGKKKVKVKKQNKIYKKKAAALVKYFFKANILRGGEVDETGNETTAEKFGFVGDGSIVTDKVYDVLAPCWTYEDKVVDKGVIR